jgi:hypothetical protein
MEPGIGLPAHYGLLLVAKFVPGFSIVAPSIARPIHLSV